MSTSSVNLTVEEPVTSPGWRVKLYELEPDGAWLDQGTGNVQCKFDPEIGGPAIIAMSEDSSEVILRSKIQFEDIYERQGESIIMWRETSVDNGEVDFALSFQDTAGCHGIWDAIGEVQRQYLQHCEYGVIPSYMTRGSDDESFGDCLPSCCHENLRELRDKLFQASSSHKDSIVSNLLRKEGAYLSQLLQLFSDIEDVENEEALLLMVDIWRSIILLNDSSIVEFIISENKFLSVSGVFEYDPSLTRKPEHRKFLTSRCVEFLTYE